MPDRSGHIEHHPVVGPPAENAEERAILVIDLATGRKIGASPHVKVEQVDVKKYRGAITTTLKITPLKAKG